MFIDSSVKRTEVFLYLRFGWGFFGESDILSLCTSAPISSAFSDVLLDVKAHQCLC